MTEKPHRLDYYTSQSYFPKKLAFEIEQTNGRLETQLVNFTRLTRQFIAYLAYLKDGGHEPRSTAYENKLITESSVSGLIDTNWETIPVKLAELFKYFELPLDNKWGLEVELTGKDMSFGMGFNSEGVAHPILEEMGTFPGMVKIGIFLGDQSFREGLKFNVGYDQYAHQSKTCYHPPQLGYVHSIEVITKDENIFGRKDGHVTVLLNSPQYPQIRWAIFDELYLWLDEVLKQERVSLKS